MAQQSVVDLFKQIAENEFGFFNRLQSVTDVMESDIPTVDIDTKFGELVGRKDVRSLGTLGVIDAEQGDLIGVIKKSTILRCYPRHLNTLVEKDEDEKILQTPLSNLVTRPVPCVLPTATPLDALEVLLAQDCDCLFVCEDSKQVLGVVTPIDFATTMVVYYKIYSQSKPLQRLRLIDLDEMQLDEIFSRGAQTARDFVRPLPTLDGEEPVLAAIKAMHDHDATLIGLTDKEESVSQVITLDDILVGLSTPANLRIFGEVPKTEEGEEPKVTRRLDLVPWEELCESKDRVLREPANKVALTRTSVIDPTARIQEVLSTLNGDADHVLLVKDENKLHGAITIREILRIFKTLLRIQSWESS